MTDPNTLDPYAVDPLDDLVDRDTALRILDVSSRTLDRLIAAEEIAVTRVGAGRGTIRFTRAALRDYLNRRTTPPAVRPTMDAQQAHRRTPVVVVEDEGPA